MLFVHSFSPMSVTRSVDYWRSFTLLLNDLPKFDHSFYHLKTGQTRWLNERQLHDRARASHHTLSNALTHWGRVTHICVGNLTIIGSDNGLSPGRRQAITWTNVGILLIGPLGTNFSEMLIEIHAFSFRKIHLKMSSGKWRPFCLGLNVLIGSALRHIYPFIWGTCR